MLSHTRSQDSVLGYFRLVPPGLAALAERFGSGVIVEWGVMHGCVAQMPLLPTFRAAHGVPTQYKAVVAARRVAPRFLAVRTP